MSHACKEAFQLLVLHGLLFSAWHVDMLHASKKPRTSRGHGGVWNARLCEV